MPRLQLLSKQLRKEISENLKNTNLRPLSTTFTLTLKNLGARIFACTSLCSMFPNFYHPNDQSKDLEFQISSNDPHQEDMMQIEDLVPGHEVLPEGSDPSRNNKKMGKGKQQQQHMILFAHPDNNEANPSDVKVERKIVRRDNERQRRQLVAVLNASLRSLLPHELIKGKRSISEHINEAVNYITQMKRKIQELNAKKEKLRRLYEYDSSAQEFGLENETLGHDLANSVTNIMVGPTCVGGVEVVISSSCSEDEGLPLSRVLKLLLAEGLYVIECSSTRVNERVFHTIQCEVDDLECVDLSELQLKLNLQI